jgi:hypothetical protein
MKLVTATCIIIGVIFLVIGVLFRRDTSDEGEQAQYLLVLCWFALAAVLKYVFQA